jgi:hypothetical protein
MEHEAWQEERHYWPIRQLKVLARFPHEYQTWLWWGHTVQNGHDAEPFESSTRLNSALLGPSLLLGEEFFRFEVGVGQSVSIFTPYFIYPEELAFKMKEGADALFDRLDRAGVSEVVNPLRRNTCKRWWQF